jgi:hypothetical protein
MFISQPGLKELSSLLDVNKNKIKEINQGWFGTSDLINIYYKKLNSLDIYSAKMEYLASTDPESKKDKEVFNITNEDLDKYLHYEIKPKTGKLVIWEQREGSDRKHYTDATEEEQMNYYEYQIKVLNRFDSAKVIADDLVNINKFFGINKEVGPNLEDITTKQYVLNDVIKSKVIEGFDLSKIPALEASYETQMAAQSWFSKYFPYNTGAYQSVKDALFKGQSNKSLSKVPVEDRVFVNNFIRYFTDNDINSPFGNVSQSFNELMLKTPGLLNGIKNFNYKDNKIGNITYDQIRNNSFIKELKTVYDKENGISYIQLQGNRLNLQVKNNVIEGFKALFKNPNTRDLAIKLIEHSFMTSGFFKGVGNYSNLIGPDVLKELGYNDYRKELISGLKNNSVSLEDKKELLIEQLIRNNPKSFTKVFDAAMFEIEDNKALPDIINTSKDLINYANRTQDMIWIDENNIPQNPKYIRVYDKVNKKASIYKKIAPFQYQYLTPLGKSNFIIEVDANNPIIKSNLRANNLLLAKERIPVTEVLEGQEEEIPQSYDDQAYNEAEAAYFESQNPITDSQEQNMPPVNDFLKGLGSNKPTQSSSNVKIEPTDKIIFGHPGIGKTELRKNGRTDIIDFDSDYKTEINKKFNLPEGFKARNAFQKSNKEEYNQAVRELWGKAKEEAKRTGKTLLASDMILLREFASDFDKVITMSKETFIDRAKQRNDFNPGPEGTEGWKNSLDKEISKVPVNKVITTDKYMSDLLPTQSSTSVESKEITQKEADWLVNNIKLITRTYKVFSIHDAIDTKLKNPIIIGETKVTDIDPDVSEKPYIIFERPSGRWMIKIEEKKGNLFTRLYKWADLNKKGEFSFYISEDSQVNDNANIEKAGLNPLIQQLYTDTNIKDPGTRLGQFEAANALQQKYGIKRTYKDIVNELKNNISPTNDISKNLPDDTEPCK